ncbi:MAG: hypothetical protein RL033_6106 [Pseudomonadota bacterium]|jgi:hypothetical protein
MRRVRGQAGNCSPAPRQPLGAGVTHEPGDAREGFALAVGYIMARVSLGARS